MKTRNAVLCLLVLLLAFGQSLVAQSKSDRLFDHFRDKPGVSYFSINKSFKDAFDLDLDDGGKTIEGDIHEIRLMSYNPEKGAFSTSEFMRKSTGLLSPAYKLVESDDDDDAKIWMLGNRKKASEFHILIVGDNPQSMSFWVAFYGDFDIKDLDGIKTMGHEMASDD